MTDGDQTAELLRRGISAAKEGRKEEARQVLLQVIERDERNEQAWLWLSGLVESPAEKHICLENVLAINPDNAPAQAGLRWLDQNSPSEPAPAPGQAHCPHCGAELPPSGATCPHCHQPLIVICPDCGEYVDVDQAACPACGRALGDFRQGSGYYLALGEAYLQQNRRDLAEEAAGRVAESADGDPKVLESAAMLYEKTGRWDQAMAIYQQALELAPDRAALYAGMGRIYRQRSQPDQARAMYEKARQLAGDDPAVLFELARLAYEEHRPASDILALLQKVLQKQPMNAQAVVLLGDVYLDLGRHKQAVQQYEQACQLTPATTMTGQEARRKLHELRPPAPSRGGQDWTGGSRRLSPDLRRRPGCITVYALLSAASAALGILSACGMGALLLGNRPAFQQMLSSQGTTLPVSVGQITTMAGIYFAIILGVCLFNLAIAIGLWYMKNWARIVEIVRQGLGLLGSLIVAGVSILSFRAALAPYSANYPVFLLVMLFIGFVIQGYFIFWFVANRELFT